jgi:2,4-dienoyl-CoA reductase-like NADH-dependent reductase (Old Yellow Enzyme family)
MSVYDIVWSRLSPYDFDENFSERITKVLATYTMKHTVEKCIEVVSRLKSGEFYCAVPITRTGFANIHRDETKQYKRIAKALGFDDILIVHKSNTTLVNSFFKCRTNHIESQDSFETIMNGLKM